MSVHFSLPRRKTVSVHFSLPKLELTPIDSYFDSSIQCMSFRFRPGIIPPGGLTPWTNRSDPMDGPPEIHAMEPRDVGSRSRNPANWSRSK